MVASHPPIPFDQPCLVALKILYVEVLRMSGDNYVSAVEFVNRQTGAVQTLDPPVLFYSRSGIMLRGRKEMWEEIDVSSAIDNLGRRGFTEHFMVVGSELRGLESGKTFGPQELIIRGYRCGDCRYGPLPGTSTHAPR
jgi:hypothetical protein